MKDIIHLIRPKDWAKNLFLFVPLFFAGRLFEMETIKELFMDFFVFAPLPVPYILLTTTGILNLISCTRKNPVVRWPPEKYRNLKL